MGESRVVSKGPCDSCGSSDANALYDDGHTYCFSCGTYGLSDDASQPVRASDENEDLLLGGETSALIRRKINEETCRKWGYRVNTFNGKSVQVATYYDKDRRPVAQKIRDKSKDFVFLGAPKKAGLYGQWLWRDGGKMIVVTEGEIDALSVSQVQGNRWPVVSVPNGAQGAARSIKKEVEWLEKFDSVIFMFDNDEQGIKAAAECASLISPGKAKIASLPLKDANDMLVAGRTKELIDAIWGAKEYRPDGIISGEDITLEELMEGVVRGYTIPYPRLSDMLSGLRKAELTLLTAGSGIGKSTLAREIAYYLHQEHALTIGNVYLEESYKKTAQGYIAIDQNVPLGELRNNPDCLSKEQWEEGYKVIRNDRMHFYKHFGSLESDNLLAKLRYFAVGLECDFIVLDHISIVVSGQDGSGEGERRDIDRLMTKLRSLVEETGVGVIAVVHLKQPEGKPHEEGGRVTLSQLRGSGSLKQLSDNVIAMERNQQSVDDSDQSVIRVLKNREFGDVGTGDTLQYSKKTGRLLPIGSACPFEGDDSDGSDDY